MRMPSEAALTFHSDGIYFYYLIAKMGFVAAKCAPLLTPSLKAAVSGSLSE